MKSLTCLVLGWIALLLVAACSTETANSSTEVHVQWETLSVDELAAALDNEVVTSAALVRYFQQRIAAIDQAGPRINAIVEQNRDAEAIAERLDTERRRDGARGPLHGIPILLKANIDTGDKMPTHAGSLALADHLASDDAFVVARLREAGAIILGKANLSEWANFRSSNSVSGWSSIAGQTRNPHVLDRNPCGSSSGSAAAVAAGLVPLSVGTETDGSIVCPAAANGVVGIKPTLGLISRDGIIPIAASQDTAGPMARSVRDAALALQAMAIRDPQDSATIAHPGPISYVDGIGDALTASDRIGVWRGYRGADNHPRVTAILERHIDALAASGATLIDPVGISIPDSVYAAEYEVLLFEFKDGLNRYLDGAGLDLRLDDVIAFNAANADVTMPWFGQDILMLAAEKPGLSSPDYAAAREASGDAMRTILSEAFTRAEIDFLIMPTNAPAWPIDFVAGDRYALGSSSLAAISGWPAVTVPAGEIQSLPIGLTLLARPWQEAALLRVAAEIERSAAPPIPSYLLSLE